MSKKKPITNPVMCTETGCHPVILCSAHAVWKYNVVQDMIRVGAVLVLDDIRTLTVEACPHPRLACIVCGFAHERSL